MLRDEHIDRVYTIVVHGTQFGEPDDRWWVRQPATADSFCERLSRELDAAGLRQPVWQHCTDFDMAEFEWSGTNTHASRLTSGIAFADYVNELQRRARAETGRPAVLNIVAHSHGGNVVLASLARIERPSHIVGIHFLGTPFFLHDDRSRWLRNFERDDEDQRPMRNIYLSAPPDCDFLTMWVARSPMSRDTADEPLDGFRYLKTRDYLQREIFNLLMRLNVKPVFRRVGRTLGRDVKMTVLSDQGVPEFLYLVHERKDPPLRAVAAIYLRQALAALWWPLQRLLLPPAASLVARLAARKIFEVSTGIDPSWFRPSRLVVSEGPGFSFQGTWMSHDLLIENPPTIEVPIGKWLVDSFGLSGGAAGAFALVNRLRDLTQPVEVFHSSYYGSQEVLEGIASMTARRLKMCYPSCIDLDRVTGRYVHYVL
jgi:hypothetical protein